MTAPLPAESVVQVVDLRRVRGREIEPVLEEEIRLWRDSLDWDFSASAELVLRFVNMKSLSGCGLYVNGRLEGYNYYITEEHKGMVGDMFLREEFRHQEFENALLSGALDALMGERGIRRVETQLMNLSSPLWRRLPYPLWLQVYPRTFMTKALSGGELAPGTGAGVVVVGPWKEQWFEEGARLITAGYKGHVDSKINDQYRALPGSRKFLLNVIQYPGCGRFFAAGSLVAFRRDTGAPCGLILSSLVGPRTGHITQICVAPEARGYGVGYELLRQSLIELSRYGCQKVSLTVTSSNVPAIRLYERMGFRAEREFAAHVWEGWR